MADKEPTDNEPSTKRKASFGQTALAVFWSFFGVRKRKHYESDAAQLNPVHVLIAGLIGAIVFVVALVLIVRMVVPG